MENFEQNEKLRGVIPATPIQVAEMHRLKHEIYALYEDKELAKNIYHQKCQYILAGIPDAYWDIDWKNCYVDKVVKEIVSKFCEFIPEALRYGQGIIFTGGYGVGKTSLACLVGKTAIAKGYTCRFIPVSKLIDLISDTYNSEYKKELFQTSFERVEVLILDDLGKEYDGVKKQLNPMVSLKIDSILRERINRNLITIATTNISMTSIGDRYGDSVLSVIHGSCKEIPIKGQDIRKIKGKKFWDSIWSSQ